MQPYEVEIYRGSKFTVEWYCDVRGNSQARDYYQSLSIERRVKFMRLVKLMADFGKIFDKAKFRSEGDRIYSFKPQPDRYLCFFFDEGRVIVTSGFEKKSEKMPLQEKERALRAKKDYERRTEEGSYYQEENR